MGLALPILKHNRYAICEVHDITYRIVTLHFEDKLAAKQWALDAQKARRNLTAWEFGQIAFKPKPEIEAKAIHNKPLNGGDKINASSSEAELAK